MSEYIITIVPVVDDTLTGPVSQTVVRIDTENGRPQVKELIMRGSDGRGLDPSQLPYVDFELLLRAFTPADGQHVVTVATSEAPPTSSEQAPPRRARAAAGAMTKRSSASRAAGTAAAGQLRKGRAYRRTPDPAALEAAYAQTGTIAGVAAHFDVPVHTAQGWISRLRQKNAFSAE